MKEQKVGEFILIAFSDYSRLMSYQKRVEELEAQLTHHLQKTAEREDEKATAEQIDSQDVDNQIGGSANEAKIDKDIPLTNLSSLLESFISNFRSVSEQIIQRNQIGCGTITESLAEEGSSENLTSDLPASINDPQPIPVLTKSQNLTSNKNFLNSEIEQLVSTVQSKYRKKAINLLHAIQDLEEFKVLKDGRIVIDGKEIANSNFFTLLPKLYKPTLLHDNLILKTVVNELSSLGLGYLIGRHYTRGYTPKGRNLHSDRMKIRQSFTKIPWYYIGDD